MGTDEAFRPSLDQQRIFSRHVRYVYETLFQNDAMVKNTCFDSRLPTSISSISPNQSHMSRFRKT